MQFNQEINTAAENGQASTCLILCERWLKDHPTDRAVMSEYATMLYKLTRYDHAIDVYQRMISLVDADDDLGCEFNQLGHLCDYRGDYVEAAQWYQQAIDENPESERSWTFLSGALAKMGRLEDAERAVREAMKCDNCFAGEAHEHLGLILRGQGKYNESADAFQKSLDSWEDDEDTLALLADVEAASEVRDVTIDSIRTSFSDRPATCVASIERYLLEDRGDTRMLLMYASLLTEFWRYDDAERVFDLLLSQNEHQVLVCQGMGRVCRQRGELVKAADWYERAAEQDPDDAANHILRGGALARNGNLEAAEACHRRATLCIRGDRDEAFLNLGLVLRGQDRLFEAAECFRSALEICEDYDDAARALHDVQTAMSLLSDAKSC